jgi:PPM family protein phosphatase
MNFAIFQDSRIGARAVNQDRVGHWRTSDALLLVVADGLGGHVHGEVAAQVALDTLAIAFRTEAKPRLADPGGFLVESIDRAHAAIRHHAVGAGLPDAPRTVIVACVVQDGIAYWSHVGDSRLYLLRKGRVVTRTRDHTRVQQLIDAGRIREEALGSHPERNKLMRCLGGLQAPQPEPVESARLAKGDVVLLCSDGFWGPLTQRQLAAPMLTKDIERAIPELVTLAEVRAGPQCDNVSVVAMAWGENEFADTIDQDTVPFHDLPTDVQDLGVIDAEYMRMSDEDIERAIDDIKASLKKSSGRR